MLSKETISADHAQRLANLVRDVTMGLKVLKTLAGKGDPQARSLLHEFRSLLRDEIITL